MSFMPATENTLRSSVTDGDRGRAKPENTALANVIGRLFAAMEISRGIYRGEMNDTIFEAFLRRQCEEGMELAADSDIVDLLPLDGPPPQRYIAEFHCRGLVRTVAGDIREWDRFTVGIYFPACYLRAVDPFAMLRWFGPPTEKDPDVFIWHPNISVIAPLICIGRIFPGTPLVDLLHQLYEVISYQRYTPNEFDSLNKACCSWARANSERFPIDSRPLKRRTLKPERS